MRWMDAPSASPSGTLRARAVVPPARRARARGHGAEFCRLPPEQQARIRRGFERFRALSPAAPDACAASSSRHCRKRIVADGVMLHGGQAFRVRWQAFGAEAPPAFLHDLPMATPARRAVRLENGIVR